MKAFEERERFGVAMRALGHVQEGTLKFLEALGNGSIVSSTVLDPPPTGNPLLDHAGLLSPEWWANFNRATFNQAAGGGVALPQEWSMWLHSNVEVEHAPTLRLLADQLDLERSKCRRHQHGGRHTSAWSDLEALAWHASHDEQLVSRMRDFAH